MTANQLAYNSQAEALPLAGSSESAGDLANG